MHIALVGWGIETKSAFRFYGDAHSFVVFNEEPVSEVPEGNTVEFRTLQGARDPGLTGNANDLSYLDGLEDFDLVIYTPTARKNLEKVYAADSPIWEKCTSSMQLFFENCPTKNIIGITGTKGKGTTTTLIANILEESGKTVHIGGNIGIPVLDLLPKIQEDDWVVLEMSNFQLYKFPYSPHFAVHLMMMPEHIDDWHHTMEDYVEAKRNICSHQSSDDITIYLPTNEFSKINAESSSGVLIPYYDKAGAYINEAGNLEIESTEILPAAEFGLLGTHNQQNICAAVTAAWQVTQDVAAYQRVLKTFSGLEHRLQHVADINGVAYYDDSFGTTPDTTIVAMDAFTQPKVLIVGGYDKGSDYNSMINRLAQDDISSVICIGITGEKIHTKLSQIAPSKKTFHKENFDDWTMDEIVQQATEASQPGDIVLLSTGSASFGIFRDYKHRGNEFIDSVNRLAENSL